MSNPAFALSESEEASWQAMASATPAPAETTETEEEVSVGGLELGEADQQAETEAPAKDKPKFVPHQALHEERERRKALEKEIQAAREERARFEERLKVIQEMNRPAPKPEENDEEAVLNDPVGALQQLKREAAEAKRQQEEQSKAQAAWQDFTTAYASKVAEYKRDDPDFDDAYQYLSNHRVQELVEAGYDPRQAVAQAHQDEANIVWQAMQRGVNPGEVLVKLAKHRGFAKKAPPARDAEQEIAKVADAKARNASFTGSGGASATDEMTADRLVKMSPAEFDAWCNKNPSKAKRLMGG